MAPTQKTAEEFTARARRLMQIALRAGGDNEHDHSHFNRRMNEAKSKSMTYVEGLQDVINQSHAI